MRALLQRVTEASVSVDGQVIGAIRLGWVVLLGVGTGDSTRTADLLADRVSALRCFEDTSGKTNLSAVDVHAEMLVVSQFTLYADTRKGRRPSFTGAAPPEEARGLVDHFTAALRQRGFPVATGVFGARMQVRLVNDGPFTLWLDTASPA